MKFHRGIYILPSLFTTGNIFCGFYAFIAVLDGEFYMASWAIVLAIIFDGLDGRIARMTKTTSEFGVQYDSLADIISFGMAPAFLIFVWMLKPFGRIGWMAGFLFLICSALRLARFNTMDPNISGDRFYGLPTPGAAAVIATIVIFSEDRLFYPIQPVVLVVTVYLLAFLMVSNIPYPAFKKFSFKRKVPFARFLFVILAFYIFISIPRLALCTITLFYALSGPVTFIFNLSKNKWNRRHAGDKSLENY